MICCSELMVAPSDHYFIKCSQTICLIILFCQALTWESSWMLVIFAVGGLFHVLLWKSDVCLCHGSAIIFHYYQQRFQISAGFPQGQEIFIWSWRLELMSRLEVTSLLPQTQLTLFQGQNQNLNFFFSLTTSLISSLFLKKDYVIFGYFLISSTVALRFGTITPGPVQEFSLFFWLTILKIPLFPSPPSPYGEVPL